MTRWLEAHPVTVAVVLFAVGLVACAAGLWAIREIALEFRHTAPPLVW